MSEKERIEVVDHKYTFSMIADAFTKDLRLTAFDRAVYLALKLFAGQRNTCWPSGETISDYAGYGRTTAFKALAHLEELGYISRTQRAGKGDFQKTTVYRLNDPESVSDKSDVSSPDELSVFATRTAGVRQTNGGCSPGEQEPYTRTIHNEPDLPLDPPEGADEDEAVLPEESDPSEADAAQGQSAEPSEQTLNGEDRSAALAAFELICADFALASEKKARLLNKVLPRWLRDYGASAVVMETRRALCWNVEHGGRKKDPERYIGNWLRRAAERRAMTGSGAEASATVVIPHVERAFDDFWNVWPGQKTGREAARREWYARFAKLDTAAKRNRAYDCLEEQLYALQDQIDSGQEPRFLGTPAHFIRDADFGERHAAV
ncbi:MAG: helix-turn-helix domain-containing protein [Pyramidobacter sp.]|nr:helix-turn-helix domain-containing protein [Pyramidobacter sp.]